MSYHTQVVVRGRMVAGVVTVLSATRRADDKIVRLSPEGELCATRTLDAFFATPENAPMAEAGYEVVVRIMMLPSWVHDEPTSP